MRIKRVIAVRKQVLIREGRPAGLRWVGFFSGFQAPGALLDTRTVFRHAGIPGPLAGEG